MRTPPERPAWWRLLKHSGLRADQKMWWQCWRDSANIGGEDSFFATRNKEKYYEHVARFGLYS